MQALTLSARRGWRWLAEGFLIFRKRPLMLSLLVLSYWIFIFLRITLPLGGQIATTVLIPVFSVSLMNACRLIEQDGRLPPLLLFSGFDKKLRPLLVLGAVYIAFSLCIFGIFLLFDDGKQLQLPSVPTQAIDQAQADELFMSLLRLMPITLPIMAASWFAPVLVAWHEVPVGKSLFFSFVACLRNWRAFLAYSAAIMVIGAVIPGLVASLLLSLVPDGGEMFSVMLTLATMFILLPTLQASFYVSYRDIFVTIDEDA